MKVRLYVAYKERTNGFQNFLCILNEDDTASWIDSTTLLNISNSILTLKDAYSTLIEDNGKIMPRESVHIVGDFESLKELEDWLKLQDLLGNLEVKTLHTLTK